MLALRGGDISALDGVYGETARAVYLLAFSILRNRQKAEDALQNTYVRLAARIGQYEPGTNAAAWILQIARSLCYREYATDKKTAAAPEGRDAPDPRGGEDGWIDNILLKEAFQTLSGGEREIVTLYAAGLKHREIAAAVGKPAGTVRWLYREAVKKMRAAMETAPE
jgi:RNA polymerase sigma-70 factor (ECF subfamily)